MATEKQVGFINKLAVEKELDFDVFAVHENTLTVGEASKLIGQLLAAPRKANAAPQGITSDGMYLNPETQTIYKVQYNRADGDGRRLYAKRLEVESTVDGYKVHFEYEAGAARNLRNEWRMTKEEAQAFGALYGTCCRCGRTLTREESIERAMGPVCAGYFL